MRRESRMPQIGDLLFVTCRDTEYNAHCSCHSEKIRHVGVVRDIERDSYGHQKHVRIEWSNRAPVNYNDQYGYAGVNIHNIRQEFSVIRNGREIK